jgi:hypothetical protein
MIGLCFSHSFQATKIQSIQSSILPPHTKKKKKKPEGGVTIENKLLLSSSYHYETGQRIFVI